MSAKFYHPSLEIVFLDVITVEGKEERWSKLLILNHMYNLRPCLPICTSTV